MRKHRLPLLALILALLCPPAAQAENPAAYAQTDAQLQTLATLRNVDEGRLYAMDYVADYRLDDMLAAQACDLAGVAEAMQRLLLSGRPIAVNAAQTGCSCFVARTREREWLYGRNHDLRSNMSALLLRTSPKDGYRSLSLCNLSWVGYDLGMPDDGTTDASALLLAPYVLMDGINEKGLAVSGLSLSGAPTRQATGRPKISTTVATRLLLDRAANVDEALALLARYDMQDTLESESEHLYLADATGRAVVVEYGPEGMETIEDTCVTNFALSPNLPKGGSGKDRYDIMQSVLSYKHGSLTRAEAMGLLSLVSQYSISKARNITLWSAVYNLTNPGLTVAIRMDYEKLFTFTMDDIEP